LHAGALLGQPAGAEHVWHVAAPLTCASKKQPQPNFGVYTESGPPSSERLTFIAHVGMKPASMTAVTNF
jgi:hypothetical protein